MVLREESVILLAFQSKYRDEAGSYSASPEQFSRPSQNKVVSGINSKSKF